MRAPSSIPCFQLVSSQWGTPDMMRNGGRAKWTHVSMRWVQTRSTSWATFPFPFSGWQHVTSVDIYTYPPFGEAQRKKKEGWYEQMPLFCHPHQFLVQAFHSAKTLQFCTIPCIDHSLLSSFTGIPALIFKCGSMASGLKLTVTLPLWSVAPLVG